MDGCEDFECIVCDAKGEQPSGHEHEAVVIRDGWRGQFLAPTAVLDIEEFGIAVPSEVLAEAKRWLAEMDERDDRQEHHDEEPFTDLVLDWLSEQGESALYDAGYVIVWEDGYVIYKREVK